MAVVIRYRFLVSWRWLGVVALALVLIATCVWLGTWQHDRYEQRAATNDRIAQSADAAPQPIGAIMAVGQPPPTDQLWSVVTVEGRFDQAGEVLIRNRSVDGQTGYEVVTPLVMDDGSAVLVDRGWVPASDQGATVLPEVPQAPAGTVEITGRVRAPESAVSGFNQVDGTHQARTVNTDQISEVVEYDLVGGYITDMNPADGFTAIPVVEERSWQNFAYAYQWWMFALMIPIGLVMLARREANMNDKPKRADETAVTTDDEVALRS